MINPEKEQKIIQKCIAIAGLSEMRGRFYLKNRKENGDKITPRIRKVILELRNLFLIEKNQWWE